MLEQMFEAESRPPQNSYLDEIYQRFGVIPNLYCTAQATPGLVEELWKFTKSAYLDNPLPTLFKERLFVHLSRFCEIRYCIVRHAGLLLGLGHMAGDPNTKPETVEQVIQLLSRSVPNVLEITKSLSRLQDINEIQLIPPPRTQLEEDLFNILTVIFVDPRRSDQARQAVKNALGESTLDLLTVFLTFIRVVHFWTETHPELIYESDVISLMEEHPTLARLLLDKTDAQVMSSNESLREALLNLAATEATLRESQERFSLAVEMAKMGTWDWDLRTGVLRWSEACSNIMGYEHKEFDTIEKFNNCVHPSDRKRVWDCIEKAREKHILYNPEFRVIHPKEGKISWVHSVGRFIYDENTGEPVRMAGLIMDINERKQSEEALRESEEFKRRIIDSSEDCIKVLDRKGNILSMNQSGAAILEIDDVTPFLNKNWASFWNEDQQERAQKALKEAASGRIGRFDGFLPTVKTQTPKWWSVIISPMMNGHDKPQQLLAVSRDVTERKLYEQELEAATRRAEEANRSKSEFLANMSHEIRTPMNAVVGLANILSVSENINAKEKRYIATLQSSAQHLMTLINNMLDISKIESSVVELEKISFNPSELVRECLKLISVEAEKKNLNISFEQDLENEIWVKGDQLRIKQILMNLLSNALKFTPKGSIIVCLSYNNKTKSCKFIVRDTGIGMNKEVCKKIFDKFMQADASTTRKYGGTGLGLAISRNLAEIMNGSINVKSEIGKGTEFTLTLPLVKHRNVGKAKTVSRSSIPEENKELKILLVEDYDANILVAKTMLKSLGYSCIIAKSGTDAINRLENEKPDLILMDVQMPEMDGYQTTKLIRQKEREQKISAIPIIAMTANALLGDKEKCLEAGMDDYISKPFNPEELKMKIATFVSETAIKKLA